MKGHSVVLLGLGLAVASALLVPSGQAQANELEPAGLQTAAAPAEEPAPQPTPSDPFAGQSGWELILVNAQNPLPHDFLVGLVEVENGYRMDYRVADPLKRMLQDARDQGVRLEICSAYRNVPYQTRLYRNKTGEYRSYGYAEETAQQQARRWVASPSESEHHTGLAVDLVCDEYRALDEGFEGTAAFAWLSENAAAYGFVLRYPKEAEAVTGIAYEPWHYRYVGTEAALEMKEARLCLEEYLEQRETEQERPAL